MREEELRYTTISLYYNQECTTVVAALAAPQTPNPARNPNPTKKKKKENQKKTLGGMPVHPQNW
jgi:hypothetical protein